jgi:hypothetical protein
MTAEKLKSIHPTLAKAIRSARNSGGIVKEGVPGTTLERPWGVVAPAADRKARDA